MEISSRNVKVLLKAITDCFQERKEELCALDRIIGDGDHGESMERGTIAGYQAVKALPDTEKVYEHFKVYSRRMMTHIGGAIGPIFASIIQEIGEASKESGVIGKNEYTVGLNNAARKVMDLGGAKVGDKTLVDALVPAAEAAEKNA